MNIQIPQRITDNFADGFNQFFNILRDVRKLKENERLVLDFSKCVFLTPFFLLPLAVLIQRERIKRNVEIIKDEYNTSFNSYLDYIFFENGLIPEKVKGQDFQKILDPYRSKSYIPIINFPSKREIIPTEIRDKIINVLNSILKTQLNLSGGFRTAIMYLIDESINNIVDHSESERGFVFAQYFQNRLFIDICIVDSGKTIKGSYIDSGKTDVKSDYQAINLAINGKSTKKDKEHERGFGIRTSNNMLVNGLKGKYLLYSGNAIFIKTIDKQEIIEIPDDLRWSGTIVALRIPYFGDNQFDPTPYYE